MCISSIPKTIGNAVGKVMPPVPNNPVTQAVAGNAITKNTATGRALKSAMSKPTEDTAPKLYN